jgi:hypothetical protein
MGFKSRSIGRLAGIAALGLAALPGAAPAAQSNATCSLQIPLRFSSPIGVAPTSGRLSTRRWVPVTCVGRIGADIIRPKVWVKLNGRYGEGLDYPVGGDFGPETCLQGLATGRIQIIARALQPVLFGPRPILGQGHFVMERTGSVVRMTGHGTVLGNGSRSHWSANGSGSLSAGAMRDCLTNGMRSATLSLPLSIAP